MERLKPIKYDKELSEFDLSLTAPCCDRLITELHLADYDWMSYEFNVCLPTRAQGFLSVKITYFGFSDSIMEVTQKIRPADKSKGPETYVHTIRFDTDIFIGFLKEFMTAHIAHWDTRYAFCGEEMAVAVFNRILENSSYYTVAAAEG